MKASIIVIGNEILSGESIDTNSAFIAKSLETLGIPVVKKYIIADEKGEIIKTVDQAFEDAGIIISTGGLGPTIDDITKKTLAAYFRTKLKFNQSVYTHIENMFSQRNTSLREANIRQAELPESAEIFINAWGTASGMLFTNEKGILISLPGVPYEMKGLMSKDVLPYLKNKYPGQVLISRNIKTSGISESLLSEKITDIIEKLPEYISIAFLPSPGQVKLRLTAKGEGSASLTKELDRICEKIENRISDSIYAFGDSSLEAEIGQIMRASGVKLSTAESCTGGYLAHLITSIAGSSDYYKGSVVAYDNNIKISELGVPEHIIEKYGAVSQACVELMATNIRKKFTSDYGIATSGIAGPGGGSPEKPTGTVWVAIASEKEVISEIFRIHLPRKEHIHRTSIMALTMLRKILLLNQTPEKINK
jgi:nicotinamide-nucleotide amidase